MLPVRAAHAPCIESSKVARHQWQAEVRPFDRVGISVAWLLCSRFAIPYLGQKMADYSINSLCHQRGIW